MVKKSCIYLNLLVKFSFLTFVLLAIPDLNASETASDPDKRGDFLSFQTDRTITKPLMVYNIPNARELDETDKEFVCITDDNNIEEKLAIQQDALQNFDIASFKEALKINDISYGELYYGIFLKENNVLIGLMRVYECLSGVYNDDEQGNNILITDAKYHKDYQGQGYGTEVKQALLEHYTQAKLIPRDLKDSETAVFKGFYGFVHLTNKASLKYNIFHCGYKVGRLIGNRVEIFYPYVMSGPRDEEFLPPVDYMLHDRIIGWLKQYLSKESQNDSAEEALRKISLQNLMAVDDSLLKNALTAEFDFLVTTLEKMPHLFESFPLPHLKLIQAKANELQPLLVLGLTRTASRSDVDKYQRAISQCKQVFNSISRIVDNSHNDMTHTAKIKEKSGMKSAELGSASKGKEKEPMQEERLVTVDGANAMAQSGTVVRGPSNTISAGLCDESQGMINGVATSVSVVAINDQYDLTLKLDHLYGGQTFEAKSVTVEDNAVIKFISTSNPRNIIAICFSPDSSGITDALTFKAALRQSLGLLPGAIPAIFNSYTTATNNGADPNKIIASANTRPGFYTLVKDAGVESPLILQDLTGRPYTALVSKDGKQRVEFTNGITVPLSKYYEASMAITPIGFEVTVFDF